MTDYPLMIWRLHPNSAYLWVGPQDNYAGLIEWRDPNTTKPTQAECDAEWLVYLAEVAAQEQAAQERANIENAAIANYEALIDWIKTGTAADAETFINGQIWNGSTQAQVEAYIDATIVNITTANVTQINAQLANIRTVFKAAAGAIIAMRGLFILTAKLVIYIRDLVIRFR